MTFEEHSARITAAKIRIADLVLNQPKWYQFKKYKRYKRDMEDAISDVYGHALGCAFEMASINDNF